MILTILKHEDDHLKLHLNMYLCSKDMADFVILTIAKHEDDHIELHM